MNVTFVGIVVSVLLAFLVILQHCNGGADVLTG